MANEYGPISRTALGGRHAGSTRFAGPSWPVVSFALVLPGWRHSARAATGPAHLLDLDLFANIETLDDHLRHSIVEELHQGHSIDLLQDSVLGLVLNVDGQPVSFFSYGYPLLAPTDLASGVQVAGILDIGLMKLDAIAGRGARKDFYDLYYIASHISLDELFARSSDKYPKSRHFGMRVLTALVVFDIADQQDEPTVLQPVEWEQIKTFFRTEARRLGQEWFGQY